MTYVEGFNNDYYNHLASQPPARAPATLGEVWRAEWRRGGLETLTGLQGPITDSVNELQSAIVGALPPGVSMEDYAKQRGINFNYQLGTTNADVAAALGRVADTFDEETQKRIAPLRDVYGNAEARAQAIERDANEVGGRTYGMTGTAVGWLAGMTRQMVSPEMIVANVATAPIGGPFSGAVARVMFRQAAAGALGQAAVEPLIEPQRAALGLEAGLGHALGNIGSAAIGSAATAGLFRAGAAVLRHGYGAAQRLLGPEAAPEVRPPTAAPGGTPEIATTALERVAPEAPPAERVADEAQRVQGQHGSKNFEGNSVEQASSPGDLEAAAKLAERDAVTAAPPNVSPVEHGTKLDNATRAMEVGSPAVEVRQRRLAQRPESTLSLFEFIASRGGISPTERLISEVRDLLGGDRETGNKFVPGFGNLVRRSADDISTAAHLGGKNRAQYLDELAKEVANAGYITDPTVPGMPEADLVPALLEAMRVERSGTRQYQPGYNPADRADIVAGITKQLDDTLARHQIVGKQVVRSARKRALEIMDKEGEYNALAAYERAIQEEIDAEDVIRNARQQTDTIPGWDDVPDDARAAPPTGADVARAVPRPPQDTGVGDRARADRERAGSGAAAGEPAAAEVKAAAGVAGVTGDPTLTAEAQRALTNNPDAKFVVADEAGNTIPAREAVAAAQDDAHAVAEFEKCIGSTTEAPF